MKLLVLSTLSLSTYENFPLVPQWEYNLDHLVLKMTALTTGRHLPRQERKVRS